MSERMGYIDRKMLLPHNQKRLAIIVIYITFDYVIMFFIEISERHDFLNKQGKRQVIVRIPVYSLFSMRCRFHHVYAMRCNWKPKSMECCRTLSLAFNYLTCFSFHCKYIRLHLAGPINDRRSAIGDQRSTISLSFNA